MSPIDIAHTLTELSELRELQTATACEGYPSFVGKNAAGESLACLVGPEGPRCVPATESNRYAVLIDCAALQGEPPPAWLAPAARLPAGFDMSWDSNRKAVADALLWRDDARLWIALRGPEGWRLGDAPLAAIYDDTQIWLDGPVLDASGLCAGPCAALRLHLENGGSGLSEGQTTLFILDPTAHVLAQIPVGWDAWAKVINTETGARSGLTAYTTLSSSFSPGRLTLRVAEDHRDDPDVGIGDGPDPRVAIRALAGVWRLDGCALVRVDGPRPKDPPAPCDAEGEARSMQRRGQEPEL